MDYDTIEDTSSEIRYLTLELMKLANNQKRPFKEVLDEFINNAYTLQNALETMDNPRDDYIKKIKKSPLKK
ncbi:hypothetical protein J7J90_00705 [Candidatus Micrarchaeota archaeon]|nr:hypothetical protein [Candidatus Micrarchaeota archaeon]